MPVAKEQIRQIIADNNISSVADVYTLLRDGFKDILQELMEAELDVGYEKNQEDDMDTANKRTAIPKRISRASTGNFGSMSPGAGTASSSRRSFPSTKGTSPELRRRSSRSMAGE